MSRLRAWGLALGLVGVAGAHPLNWTRLEVSVAGREVELRVEVDLAPAVGGYPAYLELARLNADRAEPRLREAVAEVCRELRVGPPGSRLEFWVVEAILPGGGEEEFLDPLAAPMTFFRARGQLPLAPSPLEVEVLPGFRFDQPVVVTHRARDGSTGVPVLRMAGAAAVRLRSEGPPVRAEAPAPPAPALTARILRDYGIVGFLHILPRGWDHALFVLGLFLLAPRWRPLLWQVSAFTVAHTVTLGLAAAGVLALPARVVEPLIALSIAWVAVENILHRGKLHRSRVAVVFAFGLLHGLGFAGALGGIGLPPGSFLPALAAFNLGVEAGQIVVLGAALLLAGWCRDRPWYRARVAVPASVVIGAAAIALAAMRVGGG